MNLYYNQYYTGTQIKTFSILRHGIVKYNDTSIYLIGGFQDRKLSNRTWIVNLSNGFTIKEGPQLKV